MTTIRSIHAARSAAGLDEDTARDIYERETGERHLTAMTVRQQLKVLQALNALPGATAGRPRPAGLPGPYAAKLRALWLSGWNLGVIRNPADEALLAFVEGRTGISHTRFLRDAADARKAVEALKAMLEREAGVDWTLGDIDAVIAAQGRKLGIEHVDLGADPALEGPAIPIGVSVRDVEAFQAWRGVDLTPGEKIAVSRQLGATIRRRG